MSSTILRKRLFRSVASRLTLFYAVLFGLVSCTGVLLIYLTIMMHLRSTIDAELLDEMHELSYYVTHSDLKTVHRTFLLEAEAENPGSLFCRLISSSGEVLASSDMSAWPPAQLAAVWPSEPDGRRIVFKTIPLKDERRKARIISAEVIRGRILQIGIALDKDEQFLAEFRYTAAAILTGMLALGALIGWRMARRAMAGVEDVSRAAERIAEGHLDDRVDVANYGEEIARLGRTFNHMAERIQKLMTEMRQVNDNIAHDLRSPVARIRGLAEAAVTEKAVTPECEEFAGNIVEDCDRLLHMINTMLDISEAEAGIGRLNVQEIDLAEVTCQATDLFQPVAEEKKIVLRSEISPVPPILGDLRKIQRALANLIDNALKYTDPGGEVAVSLSRDDGLVRIAVRDTGIGISDEERSRIFDRFYRGGRSRTQPGNGLGLSLAWSVARVHGGEITVDSSPGNGSTFTLILPTRQSKT